MPQLAPSSSSSSRPLRSHRTSLPWDVLAQVFQEADPSTLAILGRVSLDFLVATSGLLYKNVEVTSLKQVEKLFCKREQTASPSRINSHLSLSQIHHLFLNFVRPDPVRWLSDVPRYPPVSLPLSVSLTRLSTTQTSPSLHLDSLHLACVPDLPHVVETTYSLLLPLLNPIRFQHEITKRYTGQSDRGYLLPGPDPLNGWTRLERVDWKGQLLFHNHYLALTSAVSANKAWVCRIHLATLGYRYSKQPSWEPLVRWIQYVVGGRAGSVVLVVRNEEEKREIEKMVRSWLLIPVVEIEA